MVIIILIYIIILIIIISIILTTITRIRIRIIIITKLVGLEMKWGWRRGFDALSSNYFYLHNHFLSEN